ncbi:MAG TPA: alpha/beta hydrolase [Sphingobium sp.]|nr:alpha/beta hydrolase [Sphingobium sp.]
MSTRRLVDPELLAGLDAVPPFSFTRETLPMLRQAMEETFVSAQSGADFSGVEIETRTIRGGDGQDMAIVICAPSGAQKHARPAICHIHGGGYVFGSARMAQLMNLSLVRELGAVIVSVEYRLAPETPHPGPLEDCYAALVWMTDHAAELGIDTRRIAVKGESAGAGLAAALTLLVRDRGGPYLCHQNLLYPMLDDRTGSIGDPHPYTGEFVWTAEANRLAWACLLGKAPGGDDVSPFAAAARADDLSALPPAFIVTGALDLFVEEDMDYARRLIRAGVPTELHVYPGAYHGFIVNTGASVVAAAARDVKAALRKAFQA